MKSSLQFIKFKVLEMNYRLNLQVDKDERDNVLNPEFDVSVGASKDDINKGIVKLRVEIGNQENTYEYIRVEILGFFKFTNEDNFQDYEIENYYKVNGTAILFPYLRTLVSDLTSKGDESPIILPTVNVSSFFEDDEDVSEFEKNSEESD